MLIPSYREEASVLMRTVLSAALLEHQNRRVVVLLDDPPNGSADELAALAASRAALQDLDRQLQAHCARFETAFRQFQRRRLRGGLLAADEPERLAELWREAARTIERSGGAWTGEGDGAAERFFAERIVGRRAQDLRDSADRIARGAGSSAELNDGYRRLAALFRVRIGSFERKRYVNLSHAPNKAMNLNAYIGVIGGDYREVEAEDGRRLEPCAAHLADVRAPAADFLLTLDADSVVLPDYAEKLVAIMEADARVAVAQTPYSAFPGATSAIERIAGATTDLQYIAHQGSSAFGAEYWVGANALLRRAALEDIRAEVLERGHPTPVFIQDRTVIEDTGSTVDLIRRGWRLHNHPERLAYSATPADFGALAIQRRRWSNGGLVILPDLLGHFLRSAPRWRTPAEAAVRTHYLVSPAAANFGLLALLALQFDAHLATLWLPISAAPYYFVYGRDLAQNGYRWTDLPRVYALNLMLLPVNVAGVLDSVRQLLTGRKSPFARTPKIEGRTSTPASFLLFQIAAVAYLAVALASDSLSAKWEHAAFSGLNLGLFAYGFWRFIGPAEALADLGLALRRSSAIARAAEAWRFGEAAAPAALANQANAGGGG